MSDYKPPFHTTEAMISSVADIGETIGRIAIPEKGNISPHLRRQNRIRTIHSSLAIEQNTLSLEQVTAILDGKRVLGHPREIREVKNAYDAYDRMLAMDPTSVEDFLEAHRLMMADLVTECGQFRSGGVGAFAGDVLLHMAPPAALVPAHMQDLFAWYRESPWHPLIKSAIFHYELEFIHPFVDGNGRMGRMWHTLLLGQWKNLFFWLPVEDLIRERQEDYYAALRVSDQKADCADFVEWMLSVISDSLQEISGG